MIVHPSLACWPHLSLEAAVEEAERGAFEPLLGTLDVSQIQLVPQTRGHLTPSCAQRLRERYPGVRFRLHANARVLAEHRLADLSNLDQHHDWFVAAAAVSKTLDAPAYTAHAGRRANATLAQVLDRVPRLGQLFECPVGVEGLYPTDDDRWLLATWGEYQTLLDSGVPYALDLSHLNILAHRSGRLELSLVAELLASDACLEIHLSHNDGRIDSHRVCPIDPPWWFDLLTRCHPHAALFTEGHLGLQGQHRPVQTHFA